MTRKRTGVIIGFAALALAASGGRPALADPGACRKVTFGEPPWTDIATTDGATGVVLDALGYQAEMKTLSVPVIYQALVNRQIDAFQGNWMPAQTHFVAPLLAAHKIARLGVNLTGAKYTLAVPDYVAAGGVTSFADLAKFGAKFGHRIYGIEAGAAANQTILKMIKADGFGLKGWRLVASSEQGMLAEVARDVPHKKWIVFLAWAPHPMNVQFPLTYLSGGAKYFGPHFGGATVYTVARAGLAAACPNLAHLLGQMHFTVAMENSMMLAVEQDKESGAAAARAYLKAHPAVAKPWLAGVSTISGRPAAPALAKALAGGS